MTENGFNLTIHRANCCGNDKNCLYPHSVEVTTDAEFREAVKDLRKGCDVKIIEPVM